jgi:hypothetical protein
MSTPLVTPVRPTKAVVVVGKYVDVLVPPVVFITQFGTLSH